MRKHLSDLCIFADEKINVVNLDADTYISTENMLPNKQGVSRSAGLPTVSQTQAYKSSDVLVSNIRPYFKKIWFADRNGGCSNDVLVFKAKDNCYPRFLYYLLADDYFFDYSTSTSKGTKMPRGDKGAIMRYAVSNLPTLPEQRDIAATLSCLDEKIALNNSVNRHLERMAQAIFKSWFVDFEPWDGVMPKGWSIGCLGDVIELFDFKRVPLSGNQREKMEKIYPYYGAAALMDYVDDYLFDGIYLLLGEDGTVIDDLGFPILQYVWGKFWVNNHAHILQGRNGFTVESLYILLKQTSITSLVTGAVQPKINQANLKALEVLIPNAVTIEQYNATISPIFAQIRNSSDENRRLAALRDTLLPRLMSGELSVADLSAK